MFVIYQKFIHTDKKEKREKRGLRRVAGLPNINYS